MGILELLESFASSGVLDGFATVLIGIAVLVFLWGLVRYVLKTDTVEGKQGAKDIMVWGIITLFVIVSLWGIVSLIGTISGIGPSDALDVPQIGT